MELGRALEGVTPLAVLVLAARAVAEVLRAVRGTDEFVPGGGGVGGARVLEAAEEGGRRSGGEHGRAGRRSVAREEGGSERRRRGGGGRRHAPPPGGGGGIRLARAAGTAVQHAHVGLRHQSSVVTEDVALLPPPDDDDDVRRRRMRPLLGVVPRSKRAGPRQRDVPAAVGRVELFDCVGGGGPAIGGDEAPRAGDGRDGGTGEDDAHDFGGAVVRWANLNVMRDVRRDSFAVMQDIVVFGGGCSVLSETLESSKLLECIVLLSTPTINSHLRAPAVWMEGGAGTRVVGVFQIICFDSFFLLAMFESRRQFSLEQKKRGTYSYARMTVEWPQISRKCRAIT